MALASEGDVHFYNNLGLRHLVEKQYPNAFFIVAMYGGYATKSCTATFEQGISDWTVPALATPLWGTSLESVAQTQTVKGPGDAVLCDEDGSCTLHESERRANIFRLRCSNTLLLVISVVESNSIEPSLGYRAASAASLQRMVSDGNFEKVSRSSRRHVQQ